MWGFIKTPNIPGCNNHWRHLRSVGLGANLGLFRGVFLYVTWVNLSSSTMVFGLGIKGAGTLAGVVIETDRATTSRLLPLLHFLVTEELCKALEVTKGSSGSSCVPS